MYIDLEAQLHDLFWNQDDVLSELPLLEKFYDRKPALEIGCGSGRLLLPLLKDGYPIDGVEISSEMTDLLAQNAAKMSLKPDITTADILDFTTSKIYQRVSIPAFTAQLLDWPGFSQMLNAMHSYTSSDAQLYITLFIPWAEIAGELNEGDWYADHEAKLDDGSLAKCKTKFAINRLHQTLSRKHQYTIETKAKSKKTHRSSQELIWFTLPEITLILATNGWKLETLITDLEPDAKPHSDAHILTIIAQKS